MATQCEIPQTTLPQIDTSKRYDVYCHEAYGRIVVYRNAKFKALWRLLSTSKIDISDYFEIEQTNGQSVYVARMGIFKFCETGVVMTAEELTVSTSLPR